MKKMNSNVYSGRYCILCALPILKKEDYVPSFCEHCTEYLMESSRDVDLMARVEYLEYRCKQLWEENESMRLKLGITRGIIKNG